MNSNHTSKHALGIGMAVVFGLGASAFALRVNPAQERSLAESSSATVPAQIDPDSRITAAVKSEIGAAASNKNVEVKTKNGIVALAGSVDSPEAMELDRLAAERIAGVRYVDSSAVVVTGQ
jgi:osmotically-inducible protein OsmY